MFANERTALRRKNPRAKKRRHASSKKFVDFYELNTVSAFEDDAGDGVKYVALFTKATTAGYKCLRTSVPHSAAKTRERKSGDTHRPKSS